MPKDTYLARRVKADLIKHGYFVAADGNELIAIKPERTLIVSVQHHNPIPRRTKRGELVRVAERCGAHALIAYRTEPRQPISYRRLTGYHPGDWIDTALEAA